MPAAGNLHHHLSAIKPTVRQNQNYLSVVGRQFEGNFRLFTGLFFPPETLQMRRLAPCDATITHNPIFVLFVFVWCRFNMWRKIGVVKFQFHSPADTQFHFTRSQPLSSLLGFRKIYPDSFDRAGQQSFESDRAGLSEHARRGDLTLIVNSSPYAAL